MTDSDNRNSIIKKTGDRVLPVLISIALVALIIGLFYLIATILRARTTLAEAVQLATISGVAFTLFGGTLVGVTFFLQRRDMLDTEARLRRIEAREVAALSVAEVRDLMAAFQRAVGRLQIKNPAGEVETGLLAFEVIWSRYGQTNTKDIFDLKKSCEQYKGEGTKLAKLLDDIIKNGEALSARMASLQEETEASDQMDPRNRLGADLETILSPSEREIYGLIVS